MLPCTMRSKLLFFKYSYTSNLCGPSEQHPRSRTKFLCWMLVIIFTSERNSDSPCWDLSRDNFLTATNLPSLNFPYRTRECIIKIFTEQNLKVWLTRLQTRTMSCQKRHFGLRIVPDRQSQIHLFRVDYQDKNS